MVSRRSGATLARLTLQTPARQAAKLAWGRRKEVRHREDDTPTGGVSRWDIPQWYVMCPRPRAPGGGWGKWLLNGRQESLNIATWDAELFFPGCPSDLEMHSARFHGGFEIFLGDAYSHIFLVRTPAV